MTYWSHLRNDNKLENIQKSVFKNWLPEQANMIQSIQKIF